MVDAKKYNVAFDQFQRYETIARLIRLREEDGRKFSILELGANEHKALKSFLPEAEVLFSDIVLNDAMRQDPEFVQAYGTCLPFESGSFDFVIAADVLEHVPQEKREAFFKIAKIIYVLIKALRAKALSYLHHCWIA